MNPDKAKLAHERNESLACQLCGKMVKGFVIDSRPIDGGNGVRRRRKCESCGRRWTTYEFTAQMFNEHPAITEVINDAKTFLKQALDKLDKVTGHTG